MRCARSNVRFSSIAVACLGLFAASCSWSATYYVDATAGDDAGDGLSAANAWKTLTRVNTSSVLLPGDSVLFKCGEIWREPLVVPASGAAGNPITFGRYGADCSDTNRPTFSGADTVSGWSPASGNIHVATVALTKQPANLVQNGSLDVGERAWRHYSPEGADIVTWLESCNATGGCLRFAPLSSGSLAISSRFGLIQGGAYRLEFRLQASVDNRNINVIVRRDGSPYESQGLSRSFTVGTAWQSYSVDFTALNTLDTVRVDFQDSAADATLDDQILYIDDVRLTPLAPQADKVQQLYIDGAYARLAQHPNPSSTDPTDTYLLIAQHQSGSICPATGGTGTTTLVAGTDIALTPEQASDMAGAGVHIRTNAWLLDDRIVTAFDPQTSTITFDKATPYNLCKDWGYYLDNKLWMLDAPGEWYYDAASQQVYAWMPDGGAPEGRVEAGHYDVGVDLRGRGHVVIDGLRIEKMTTGVDLSYSVSVTVRNTEVTDSAANGVVATEAVSATVENSTVARSVRDGIQGNQSSGMTIADNRVIDSGVVGSPKKSVAAIKMSSSTGAQIQGNHVLNNGYVGIFVGKNSGVSGNYIEDSCLVLDDCGAIYIGGHDDMLPRYSSFTNNVVNRSVGNLNGKPPGRATEAQGIYLDDYTTHMVVTGNTVIDADYGIQVHNAANSTLTQNTVYGGRKWPVRMSEDAIAHEGAVHDNLFSGNRLFPTKADVTYRLSGGFGNNAFASYDNNRYSSLYSRVLVTDDYKPGGVSVTNSYTLEQWQQQRGQDLGSTSFDAFGVSASRATATGGPNFIGNSTFDTGVSLWSRWNGTNEWASSCVVGGCLKFTRSADTAGGLVNSSSFSVQGGATYLVKFDLRGGQEGQTVKVFLRGAGNPNYNPVGLNVTLPVGTAWETYAFPVTATESRIYDTAVAQSGARLDFEVAANQVIYIDNVRVEPATIETNDPADDSRILFNAEASSADIDCPDAATQPQRCTQYVHFADGAPVTWPLTLAAHASEIVIWSENPMKDVDRDGIADTSDLCADSHGGSPVNESGCNFSQMHPADVAIAQTADVETVLVGGAVNYTLTITNAGVSTAHDVTVGDILPAGMTYTAHTVSQGSCTGGQSVTCDLGHLAAGAAAVVTITASAAEAGVMSNTATAGLAETDPNPANNTATTTVQVAPVADLAAVISVSASQAVSGDALEYTVRVTNNGPSPATGVVVTGLEGCTLSSADIPAGGAADCTVTVVANPVGAMERTVSVAGNEHDPDAANDSASTTTNVQGLLTIAKAGSGGGVVTSAPAGIDCGADCSEAYDANATVTLTTAAANDSDFTGWSGCVVNADNTCTATVDGNKTVTASFALKSYSLTLNTAGTGTGTVTGDGTYTHGSTATVTATAAAGSAFDGWSGPDGAECETGSVAMIAEKNCTATFTLLSFRNPSAHAAQAGGDGNGYQTNPANAYTYDTAVAVDTNSGTNTNTSCTNNGKDKHAFYNYGFSVPAGAAIKGIEVKLNARADSTSGGPKICVQLSWDGGRTWTVTRNTPTLTKTLADYTLGGAADTWGRAWNETNLSDANFRVRIINVASNISRDFSLNNVAVKVTY